ncbi:hypothetical protein GIB67_004683 [Kingdonia uniflora]|uniref:Uncharacterized protein n=1 Tax=Kingdonia uniflora TaxID=39325 RepID=A0A7J7P4X2_9MAGN|nr:hypothetical protein GIB67_004683 [Kingdonia uniflora]
MQVLKNGLDEVELTTGLPHKDSVENPKSTKANASQSEEVKVKEILTIAQGCERGHPPGTRLKSRLELNLRQCDAMLTEATCSEKNVHLSKSNARKHPTSPHQNEVLSKCDTMPIEATCSEKDVHSSTNEENVILNPTFHTPTYYPSQIVQPLVPYISTHYNNNSSLIEFGRDMEFEELSSTSHMSFNQLLHQVSLTDGGESQLFANQCAQPTNSTSYDFMVEVVCLDEVANLLLNA